MEYRVISADCRIDMTWMPGDLWTTQAPAVQHKILCENAGKLYGLL
jgi:hypothetical protein